MLILISSRRQTLPAFWMMAALLSPLTLHAQLTGAIEGTVTDPSGRRVSAAEMHVTETTTNAERTLATNQQGWYRSAQLVPGRYRLTVTAAGFETARTAPLELIAGETIRADIELKVGAVHQSVVVTAETSKLDVAAGGWGSAIDGRQLDSLPLNGRDVLDLAQQQPGVTAPASATRALDVGTGLHISINGNRPSENAFRLDGIYINDGTGSAPASAAGNLLGIDTLAELQVVTSPFSAEYGRTDGGVVTAISKSGTNDYHGSVWEYLRNSALDSKNYFDPVGKIPALRMNQFGGLLSGAVAKDKLFFLSDFEGLRSATNETQISATPNAQAREGWLPVKGALKKVPISPAIAPYLALYPLPNGPDLGNGTGEYITGQPGHTREDFVVGKLDFVHSERLRFGTRYTFDTSESTSGDGLNFWNTRNDSHYNLVQTTAQFVQSPTMIHDFREAFSQIYNGLSDSGGKSASDIAFVPGLEMGAIQVVGLANFGGTTARTAPRHFNTVDSQLSYSGEKMSGEHSLSFGASFDRILLGENADLDATGYYQFNSLQSFLAAQPNRLNVMAPGTGTLRHWSYNELGAFIQENWRISRRLSVGAGVRYETASTPAERDSQVATLPHPLTDANLTVGGPLWINPSKRNFAPRASITWDPFGHGRTVIRAGSGIFYNLLGARELVVSGMLMPPFFEHYAILKPSFPNALAAVASVSNPSITVDTFDFRPSQPYIAQYQLMVQHDLGHGTVAEVGYSGSRGIHLVGYIQNIDTTSPVFLPNGQIYFPANNPPINPAFGSIAIRKTDFDSTYNSLVTDIRSAVTRSLHLQAKFVWSHAIDDDSMAIRDETYTSEKVPTMYNYAANKGSSDFDCKLAFAANFSWQLPSPRARLSKVAFSGWELNGLMQAQSGNPFNPTVGFDNAHLRGTNDSGQRPGLVSRIPAITGDPSQYFNPLAFSLPASGTYGNLGRNTLIGPRLVMVSLALGRTLLKTERGALRIRAEVFNVPNHPNFQIPSGIGLFDSTGARLGTAGQITTTTTSSRQIQLSARYTF